MIVTATFERRTFRVQAIRVTAENMTDLAEWTGGQLKTPDNRAHYIDIPTGTRGNRIRAYAGDWITRLAEGTHCRVYKNRSFLEAFREILSEEQRRKKVQELVKKALYEQDRARGFGNTVGMEAVVEVTVHHIMELF